MRTITSFLLPARTSCTRSFRDVQLSVRAKNPRWVAPTFPFEIAWHLRLD